MNPYNLTHLTDERLVQDTDKERARFVKNLFKADWEQLRHYHLLLDTGRLGIPTCVELIVQAVESLERI